MPTYLLVICAYVTAVSSQYLARVESWDSNDMHHEHQDLTDPEKSFYVQPLEEQMPSNIREMRWLNNLIDFDGTDLSGNGRPNFVGGLSTENEENKIAAEKKNFSPWGGKRNSEENWNWQKPTGLREPMMPKRARFSPWGGKRSGQLIYKPGGRSPQAIFSPTIPQLIKILSSISSDKLKYASLQFMPTMDKRHPLKLLAMDSNMGEKTLREVLPFKAFMESLPKLFKPGHRYSEVNLKKDGKRKVKFSAWGGKRSPPVIGPIWTPPSKDMKESILNAILLIRKKQEQNDIPVTTS